MKTGIIMVVISSFLVSLCGAAPGARGETGSAETSIKKLIAEIGSGTDRIGDAKKPVRLAVVTFVSTQKDKYPKNEFGEYLTESLITGLKKERPRIRLFERKRLEAILNENSLSMSGLIGRDEAKRIGELAPVDNIITGSYTVFSDRVEINGRVIDVLTGEIVFAFHKNLPSDDIRGFFREKDAHPVAPDEKTPCRDKWGEVREKLADLSSESKIQSLVVRAVTIPFDMECGKIHFEILQRFTQYKIYHRDYNAFLRKTLHSIKVPIDDYRASTIMRYFHNAGPLDEDTWNACLGVIKRCPTRYMSQYIGLSFHEKGLGSGALEIQKKRIDRFFALASEKKMGLPVPISYTAAFHEMSEAMVSRSRNQVVLPYYCFERYFEKTEVSELRGTHSRLFTLYKRDNDAERKEGILKWICHNFNRTAPDEILPREMMSFVRYLNKAAADPEKDEKARQEAWRHLETFRVSCGKQLEASLPIVKYPGEKKDRIVFCIKNNIRCSLVPDTGEMKKKLESEDSSSVLETLSLINEMEERAKPYEKEITLLLVKANKKKISRFAQVKHWCIKIMGNIKTRDRDALDAVAASLLAGGHTVYEEAARIGSPLVPNLVRILRGKDHYDKIAAVRVLNLMGAAAKSALPDLKAEMNRTTSAALKEKIREAVMRIE